MKRIPSFLLALTTTASLIFPAATHADMTTSSFGPGDLIKGHRDTVYYLASDGKRYVFPSFRIYFTWYADFSKVKTISDAALSYIPIGGNVTYRPGVKMVKLTSDPNVYVVDRSGVLRRIETEELAQNLYGIAWQGLIDDVPDSFFSDYTVGTPVKEIAAYKPDDVSTQTWTIEQDKHIDQTRVTISIGDPTAGFVPPTLTIQPGTTITWTNQDTRTHHLLGSGWDSGDIPYTASYSRTFSDLGSFDYHCVNYPGMIGTVNVTE